MASSRPALYPGAVKNPFNYGRGVDGVCLSTHFTREIGDVCATEQEVDLLIERVKSLLDETASEMKAALKNAVEE